jgi:chromosome segregation protein
LENTIFSQKRELESAERKLRELQDSINQTTMDEQLNNFLEEQMRIEKEIIMVQSGIKQHKHTISQTKSQLAVLKEERKELSQNKTDFSKKQKELEKDLKEAEKEYQKALKSNQELLENREQLRLKVENEREKERAFQEKIYKFDSSLSEIKIEQSKFETRLQDIKEELKNYENIQTLNKKDTVELKKRIPVLESEMKKLGPVNLKALEDFGHYEQEVIEIKQKVEVLDEEKDAVLDLIEGIELKRTEAFMECFNAINENFNKLYMNFFNGTAHLGLTDPEKPLDSGLIIEAKHGDEKRLKNIDSMSGGEKSLTSLAFIFAIQMYEPAPFYFFDEVDAALDLTNSQKVGELIKEMSKSSQFIAITHNDTIVKVADRIIGVAKKTSASSVIGLKVGEKEKAEAPA